MYVRITYADGNYAMVALEEGTTAGEVAELRSKGWTIAHISDAVWRGYEAHLDAAAGWQTLIRMLDNEEHVKEEKDVAHEE